MTIDIIKRIYALVAELEQQYPGRHFTPDGHMLGSIGEIFAAEKYGLRLYGAGHPVHDAITADGREVQIKITQTNRISLYECPDYLIVLKIDKDGAIHEVYNGPGAEPWNSAGTKQKNGQRSISIRKLMDMMVPEDLKIKEARSYVN